MLNVSLKTMLDCLAECGLTITTNDHKSGLADVLPAARLHSALCEKAKEKQQLDQATEKQKQIA
ncbi:MAG TPA: hypothetical protein VFM18_07375 [Methanosarcina sp.]|nr:hypothetical protein [Methanosarcina sp.]